MTLKITTLQDADGDDLDDDFDGWNLRFERLEMPIGSNMIRMVIDCGNTVVSQDIRADEVLRVATMFDDAIIAFNNAEVKDGKSKRKR